MGEVTRRVARWARDERALAVAIAAIGGVSVWMYWPVINVWNLSGGVATLMRLVAVVGVALVAYRVVRPRPLTTAERGSPALSRLAATDLPVAVAARRAPAGSSLLEEIGDDHLVKVALARAVNPDDVAEVRALIDELRADDQRTPRATPSPALLSSPYRRARHEAAHAVVALATGATIESAVVRDSLDADGRGVGGNVNAVMPLADFEVQLWSWLQFCLAGMVIDHRRDFRDHGSMSDVRKADEAAAGLVSRGVRPPGYTGEMTTSALFAAATAAVEELLDTHAQAVSRITAALIDATKDGRELRDPDLRVLFEEADVDC